MSQRVIAMMDVMKAGELTGGPNQMLKAGKHLGSKEAPVTGMIRSRICCIIQ
ncbi:MAG: hypothetical protein GVY20_11330 [Bacteroidetes bacterium]|nr:hypothetical protein [Bacteroidota bacterium]